MDTNKLIPDFNAIGKTDWSKPQLPQLDKNNILVLVALGGLALMFISLFLPWFRISGDGESVSRLGITMWNGILGFIFVVVAAGSILYNHRALALWAAAICIILAFFGFGAIPALTVEGESLTSEEVEALLELSKLSKAFGGDGISVSRIGVIFFFIGSLAATASSFMLATDTKLKI